MKSSLGVFLTSLLRIILIRTRLVLGPIRANIGPVNLAILYVATNTVVLIGKRICSSYIIAIEIVFPYYSIK